MYHTAHVAWAALVYNVHYAHVPVSHAGWMPVIDSLQLRAAGLAPPLVTILWQATLLSAIVALALLVLRKRSPLVRHALVMLALTKYITPPIACPLSIYRIVPSIVTHPTGTPQFADPEAASPTASLLAYWVLGAAVLFAYTAVDASLRRRALRAAKPVDHPSVVQATERMGMRRTPAIVTSEKLAAPHIAGLWSTTVALPAWVFRLPRHDIDALVAHELAHVRRHDRAWERLTRLIQILWWWNPVVWWLCSRARHERELAADDIVVAQRIVDPAWYTSTLVDVAERIAKPDLTSEWLGLREPFHPLKRRILRALDDEAIRHPRLKIRHALALLITAALVLPTAPPKPESPPAAPGRHYRYPPLAIRAGERAIHSVSRDVDVDIVCTALTTTRPCVRSATQVRRKAWPLVDSRGLLAVHPSRPRLG